jgi:integration host factor subunit beta
MLDLRFAVFESTPKSTPARARLEGTSLRYVLAQFSICQSELIARLAKHYPQLVTKDIEIAANAILEAITASLAKGRRVEVRGFGSFEINYRPPRIGRNPNTGENVPVLEKFVPHFKAGRELRERVDG